jgi:perosamine synthetase
VAEVTESTRPGPRIRLAHPDVGDEEIAAVAQVLRSGTLTGGPETRHFEREFADFHQIDHAVAFTNGTVALTAMFIGLGIGAGDEVIVPSLTFVSSVTSIVHAGATPVFAEVDPDTFNIDPADAARRIGPRVKALLAVHYGGQPADLAELRDLTDEAGIVLLEDAAEAHGAKYRHRYVGGWGRAAMFSFTPTKNITTGEGGMVTTRDGDLAERLRLLRNHGQTGRYVHQVLGWNWRMTEMQAAMGRCQVAKLSAILERKAALAALMDTCLLPVDAVQAPARRPDRDHVFMLYTVKVPGHRDAVLADMLAEGIEARVYFPPVHRQPLFDGRPVSLPVTEQVAGRILSLPLHSRMTAVEVKDVAATLSRAVAPQAGGSP